MPTRINIDVVDGEYRIPSPCGREVASYYTMDRTDAINTARFIYGRYVPIRFRNRESFGV